MADNRQLQIALEVATMAHKGVVRRNGDPYIFHALRVADNTKFIKTKVQKCAGILHDVLEDTPLTVEFLRQQGIGEEVINILKYLTHDKNTPYEEYIRNICNSVDAMLVKLSDLTDNLDQGTLPVIADKDRERFMVYENARTTIMGVLARDYPDTFKEIMMSK